MKKFSQRFHARAIAILSEEKKALTRLGEAQGLCRMPTVVYFVPEDSEEIQRAAKLCKSYFTFADDPSVLTYKTKGVFWGNQRVDYVRAIDLRILASVAPNHPLLNAIRSGALKLLGGLNPLIVKASRVAFDLLTDEETHSWFPTDIQKAIKHHLPWTRRVADSKTSFQGENVELIPLLRKHKNQLVLKECGTDGGRGTVLGWRVDASTWTRAIRKALRKPTVVQQRVHIPKRSFPVFRNGRIQNLSLFSDFNPFVWNQHHAAGAHIRLSRRDLLNVAAGGWVAPLFIVSELDSR